MCSMIYLFEKLTGKSCCLQNKTFMRGNALVSALSHFNKMENHEDPTQNVVIKRALQGFQKLKGTYDTRLPITPSGLNRLVNSLNQCTASYYQRC